MLDEPFANADSAASARLLATLKSLAHDGRTILAVHHDLATVRTTFDRALVVAGRIVADGPPHMSLDSSTLAAAYGIDVRQHARPFGMNAERNETRDPD
jgi:manganese/zinc/iron transport system ATP- binding protein